MIEVFACDHRGRFSHAVALHDAYTKILIATVHRTVQRRSTTHDEAEIAAQLIVYVFEQFAPNIYMDLPERAGDFQAALECLLFAFFADPRHDPVVHRFEQQGDADEDGHAVFDEVFLDVFQSVAEHGRHAAGIHQQLARSAERVVIRQQRDVDIAAVDVF